MRILMCGGEPAPYQTFHKQFRPPSIKVHPTNKYTLNEGVFVLVEHILTLLTSS